jgi:hypothetical protein
MRTVTTVLTFAEFEQSPGEAGRRGLLPGELIELRPAKKRFRVEHPGIPAGDAYYEMGYRPGPRSWLQPDASLTHPGQPGGDYYDGAPLITVEVVSEAKTADSIGGKTQEYLTHGGLEVWAVYPKSKPVRLYRETGADLVETKLTTDLLPGFSLDLRSLFESA